ncbi:MAG: class I SAM-dependent methyltransferase [Actinobacteria bacterium]|nr:class I SAM-dependent methyltransferase [Actinomycetota bacterium]
MSATRFTEAYKGKPPWDIGRPQPVFKTLADAGAIAGPVLDVGCGTGENALFLAARGFAVVGVDAVEAAVEAARRKAVARGLEAEFLVHDALALEGLGRRFATVVDSGLFHTFDDRERRRFVTSLAAALALGGRYYVLCFSERERRDGGPRRVTQAELRAAFDHTPFRVLSIEAAEMAANLDGGGRKAWLARIERVANP